ncbi:MAG: glycogen debranching protein GlgX [Eubacterium sp.]|nr:glycogen debranching protein GlgX [Eubacterium sp.]
MKPILQESKFHLIPLGEICGYKVRPGMYEINGATAIPGGVNFTIHSNQATYCELLLFRRKEEEPYAVIPFPENYRIGNVFSMIVFGLQIEEFEYAYRMDGPYDPKKGLLFDRKHVLLDPYAKAVTGQSIWGKKPQGAENPYHARVVKDDFDWEDAKPLLTPLEDTVIYEMHVRGFTQDPSSGVKSPGTFAGLSEKIPYLKELGVTAVELMPIFEFDEMKDQREYQGNLLLNYWGYNTISFFAPNTSYAAGVEYNQEGNELKNLIKRLHENGMEVYLDVVFNHTAEGNEQGPVISFKGLDNQIYYILTPDGYYYNFSGCGNTLNCNHPIVQQMILECLRYWVITYRVDGFRFDLASILGRNEDGSPMRKPPLLQSLAFDPILGNVKLIAEAWDAGGLYQVGNFPSWNRWVEWNGKYRDDMRSFLKGDNGKAHTAVTRIFGSEDLYEERLGCNASVNFITCHDGFTLYDLYAYNQKHNEANGWDNSDGSNDNASWNCGAEGETENPEVMRLRIRMMKNAAAILLLSRGVPMFLAGDEFGNTQFGNNNPYCQDNPISWLDWRLLEKNRELFAFFKYMIAFRKRHDPIRKHTPSCSYGFPEMSAHDVTPWENAFHADSHYIGIMFAGRTKGADDCVYIAVNTYWEALSIQLPKLPLGHYWYQIVDTYEEQSVSNPPVKAEYHTVVRERSVVVFQAGTAYE